MVNTCPLCNWSATATALTFEEAELRGKRMIFTHNRRKHPHRFKPGAEPRLGYYKGKPIS